jgi:hypothetical protein
MGSSLTPTGATGHYRTQRRWQTDQDALWRRKIVFYSVPTARALGCYGLTDSLSGRVVSGGVLFCCLIETDRHSDVFMDSVNRERSMEMIIQAARRSIGRQFIFITPQAMNNVKHTSDVKIIRMSDPERNQTALSFRQT